MQRFASSALYAGVAQGISAGFVAARFAAGVPWDLLRLILAAVAFVALVRRVDVVYVVLAGIVVSLIVR